MSRIALLWILMICPVVEAIETEQHITHGPILGRVTDTSVGVWARTGHPGKFQVQYGLAPDKLDQESLAVTTKLTSDCTGWVEIRNLIPDTKYYYKVVLPGVTDLTARRGSFRTLPNGELYKHEQLNPKGLFNFKFEYACGNNQNPGHSNGPALPAFNTMLREIKDDINFAILNGDWLYETQREYTPAQWMQQVGMDAGIAPKLIQDAPSIVGVWQNYKHFMNRAPALEKWHSQVPSFFTYDDHEILNDIWGAGSPGLRDRRAVFRDVGVRAWYDYLGWANPTNFPQRVHISAGQVKAEATVLTDKTADFTAIDLDQVNNLHVHWGTRTAGVNENALDGVGGLKNAGVYEIVEVLDENRIKVSPAFKEDGAVPYSIGRRSYFKMSVANCDFFVCDTRGQREMHDRSDPHKEISMLGLKQREWLLRGVRESEADFIFVVSSVNFMVPHVGGGVVRANNKDDAWTVFYHEREMLIEAWDEIEKPVFVMTGDLHNSFACQITDNVFEFASGPHNSNNHYFTDEGDRPANGLFKYGPREVDILWSTRWENDVPRDQLRGPTYCVVQINNVYNNPLKVGDQRWVAFPRPQVVFQYYNGVTGKLRWAHSVRATAK